VTSSCVCYSALAPTPSPPWFWTPSTTEQRAVDTDSPVLACLVPQGGAATTTVRSAGPGAGAPAPTAEHERRFDDEREDEKAELLAGMEAPADPTMMDKAKGWSWLWGVGQGVSSEQPLHRRRIGEPSPRVCTSIPPEGESCSDPGGVCLLIGPAARLFAVFLVGAVLLFWDDMHVKKETGRPEVGAGGCAEQSLQRS
jgi:hypothetical protein